MWNDLRLGLRGLLRHKWLTLVVVGTVALGIAGTTAIFSVVNAALLRDLPYPESDQIYLVTSVTPEGSTNGRITPRETRDFYETLEHPTVEAGAIAWNQEVQIIGEDGLPHPTLRYGVTDGFFLVFGQTMALGQAFEFGQGPGPIIITYPIWRDLFASDPDIIGKTVTAEGIPRMVVGVTPESFSFPRDPGYFYLMNLGTFYDGVRGYEAYVRLRPGQRAEQLQAELTRHGQQIGPDPVTNEATVLVATPFLDFVVGDLRSTVMLLFGATALLLLIAAINVTNLLLSRATVRTREMALREAIGAGRLRILRQLLTESLVLTLIGGAAGLAIAVAAIRIFLSIAPTGLPRLDSVPIDTPVLAFAGLVTLLTGALVGLAPAWRLSRTPLQSLVNEGGRGMPGGAHNRLFSALVVSEIALAVLLVIGAGLLVRNYASLTATDAGFDPDGVVTAYMYVPGRTDGGFVVAPTATEPPERTLPSYRPMTEFFRELETRIAAIAGVERVASTSTLALRTAAGPGAIELPGEPSSPTGEAVRQATTRAVTPDYFDTLDIRLLAGRGFEPTDRIFGPGAAIVSETFARRYFGNESPIGKTIRYPENLWAPGSVGFQLAHLTVDEVAIVGVVEDVLYDSLSQPPDATIYLPGDQFIHRRRTLVVKSAIENPESLIPAIRTEIEAMDPLLTADFALYPDVVSASLATERFGMTLLVVFGGMALFLAAVGIYGLVSYSVAQRHGEIAVRAAMGATNREVVKLIMRQGALLALAGVVLGILGAAAMRQVVAAQLYGVGPLDPVVFMLVPPALFAVSALACFLPARRATRIHPAELLRSE